MPRPSSKTLTEAEQRVMQVLWSRDEASVREVADALPAEPPLAYNTVLTTLSILHKKKYVRFRREGRAHIYSAAITESDARHEAFDNLLSRFFGGSKNAFAQYLIEEAQLDAEELADLKKTARNKRSRGKRK